MKYSLCLLCLLLSQTLFAQNEAKNDLQKMNIKGKVKTLTYLNYDAYDKFGKMQIKYTGKEVNTFDNYGNLISKTTYDLKNQLVSKGTYLYDKTHNLIEINLFHGSIFKAKSIMKYDQRLLSETDRYYKTGDIMSKTSYEYDNSGNLIREDEYNADGTTSTITKYVYENYGGQKSISKNVYTESEANNDSEVRLYDSLDNVVNVKYYKNDTRTLELEYTYNSNGDIISIRNDETDPPYDANITFSYKYDLMGNSTDKIRYERKFDRPTPVEYVKVEIVYIK